MLSSVKSAKEISYLIQKPVIGSLDPLMIKAEANTPDYSIPSAMENLDPIIALQKEVKSFTEADSVKDYLEYLMRERIIGYEDIVRGRYLVNTLQLAGADFQTIVNFLKSSADANPEIPLPILLMAIAAIIDDTTISDDLSQEIDALARTLINRFLYTTN